MTKEQRLGLVLFIIGIQGVITVDSYWNIFWGIIAFLGMVGWIVDTPLTPTKK